MLRSQYKWKPIKNKINCKEWTQKMTIQSLINLRLNHSNIYIYYWFSKRKSWSTVTLPHSSMPCERFKHLWVEGHHYELILLFFYILFVFYLRNVGFSWVEFHRLFRINLIVLSYKFLLTNNPLSININQLNYEKN